MALPTLLETIDSDDGVAAIVEGTEHALASLKTDLHDGLLGGTELAYDVGVKQISTGLVHEELMRGHMVTDTPDPEGGAYDYYKIAGQKQDVSLRTHVTMREAKTRGLLRDDDVKWIGNAVFFLDNDGDYILVVSCSGLNDLADEAAAELIAAEIKRRLVRVHRKQLALAA